MDWLEQDTSVVWQLSLFGAIVAVALWEVLAPRRRQLESPVVRWPSNLLLLGGGFVVMALLKPIGGAAIALFAADSGWGLLNLVSASAAVEILLGVVLLDLLSYLSHRLHHAVPVLWRLHGVHHSDTEVDFTTTYRHHPLGFVTTLLLHMIGVLLIGPAVIAVLLYSLIRQSQDVATHANARLPARLDRALRLVFVTPDMHRIHHSAYQPETDSNFSQLFSVWDRLFGTYTRDPVGGQKGFTLGLETFRSRRDQWADRLLLQPFRRQRPVDDGLVAEPASPATHGAAEPLT